VTGVQTCALPILHRNHAVHGLVLRGIANLIDGKAEAEEAGWPQIAARHAAAFAFQVLSKFTLPSGSEPSRMRHNLPLPPNPYFTGRDVELQKLFAQLHRKQQVVIGQTKAISGLGGVVRHEAT